MEQLQWCKKTFDNQICQQKLEEKLLVLIELYFNNADDYSTEKFIKSFSEGLGYLEKLMLFKNGIHHNQINSISSMKNKTDIIKKYKEVEKTILVQVDRQFKNYSTFLASIKN